MLNTMSEAALINLNVFQKFNLGKYDRLYNVLFNTDCRHGNIDNTKTEERTPIAHERVERQRQVRYRQEIFTY